MTSSASPPAPPSTGRLLLVLGVTWLGLMFDGLEMGLYGIMIRPALKGLLPPETLGVSPDKAIGPYISYSLCAFMVGAALGGALFGRIADRIGRSKAMVLTIIVYALFTGLTGFVTTFPQLLACRFLGALGLGGEWGVGVALLVETWPEKRRPLLAGIAGCAINVGFLVASLLAKEVLTRDWEALLPASVTGLLPSFWSGQFAWRLAFTAGVLPALLTLAVRFWVPEPERWVRSREKARAISAAVLFGSEYRRRTLMACVLSGVALLGTWGSFLWLPNWVDQIATGAQRDTAKATVGFWQAVGMIGGSFIGGPLAEWLGRRRSYALLCVMAYGSVMALYGLNVTFGVPMLVMAVVAGVFVTAFFGWAPLYLPELFPTHLRAYGQGLSFNMGRFLTAAGVLVGGQLVAFFGGSYPKAMMWMASIYLVGLIAIWFAPETKGQALPD